MSAPAKAVYLIAPGYRRWITPDATELVFETEGFAPNESTPWQANLTVRDLDSDTQTQSTTPIDLSGKTFTLPVPKFHRRAEIILFIEDRRREPVAEGRWKLTNIPKEELPGLSYFDSRGVFFHEGVGRFPIVAWPSPPVPSSQWESLAASGYSAMTMASSSVDEKTAALANKLKLLLFVYIDNREFREEIRRVMRHPCVAGYIGGGTSDEQITKRALEGSALLRSVDPSRPNFTILSTKGQDLNPNAANHEDALEIMMQPFEPVRRFACVRSGRPHFASTVLRAWNVLGGPEKSIQFAVASGASGAVFHSDAEDLERWGRTMDRKLVESIVHAVVRGTPLASDDSTEDHWYWRRRLGPNERAVIEVKRGEPPTAMFRIEKTEN